MDRNTTPQSVANDETLMHEFRRGAQEAFSELFARYRESVKGIAKRLQVTGVQGGRAQPERYPKQCSSRAAGCEKP